MTPVWKRPGKGSDDDVEPWEPGDLLPDDGPPAAFDADDPALDEWTEEDERRYQARREEERRVAARRRRQATVFGVIVVMVLGIGLFAAGNTLGWWSVPFSSSDGDDDAAEACPAATPTAAPPDQVTVVVLNSTDRAGLAGEVARGLQTRGFTVREIGNDTSGELAEAAQVRHGPEGLMPARTVAAHVTGAVLVEDDRPGAVVDLSLGAGFAELATPEEAAARAAPVAPEGAADCTPGTGAPVPGTTP